MSEVCYRGAMNESFMCADEDYNEIKAKIECSICGLTPTKEGHDPCLGELPGVRFACCGHGNVQQAYISFENGIVVRGFDIVEEWNPGDIHGKKLNKDRRPALDLNYSLQGN